MDPPTLALWLGIISGTITILGTVAALLAHVPQMAQFVRAHRRALLGCALGIARGATITISVFSGLSAAPDRTSLPNGGKTPTPHAIPSSTATPKSRTWAVVSSPMQGKLYTFLRGVAAVSTSDVWAVGSYADTRTNDAYHSPVFRPLIEHFGGTTGTIATSPASSPSCALNAIAMLTHSDGWAVGQCFGRLYYANTPLIEHWDGTQWTEIAAPTGSYSLTGVAAVSATDVWAIGAQEPTFDTSSTVALHWNGLSWAKIQTPNPNSYSELLGVAAIASNDVWAVGDTGNKQAGGKFQALVERWNGRRWTTAQVGFATSFSVLTAVTVLGPENVWAVGRYYAPGQDFVTLGRVAHWDGLSWRVSSGSGAKAYNGLNTITARSPSDIWAAGDSDDPAIATLEHWDGRHWTNVTSAVSGKIGELDGVAMQPTGDLWGVGMNSRSDSSRFLALIVSYV